jgi:hypothetical protein
MTLWIATLKFNCDAQRVTFYVCVLNENRLLYFYVE